MTYQDDLLTAEPAQASDTMIAERDYRIDRPTPPPAKTHGTTRADAHDRTAMVMVLEDGRAMSDALRPVCAFLNVAVDRVDCTDDLLPSLQRCRPMAVVAAMDTAGQDGGHVLKTVARHDPSLPVLLMTDGDPRLEGAADAVTELWRLTEVVQAGAWPSSGAMIEFLCRAGLRGNCLSILPV